CLSYTRADHFATRPHCLVMIARAPRVGRAGSRPSLCTGIISAAGVQQAAVAISAPDDHLTTGPECRVKDSGSGRIGITGGCPTICAGIVAAAGVEVARSRENDTAAPEHDFHLGTIA